jgi:hypothetical protein
MVSALLLLPLDVCRGQFLSRRGAAPVREKGANHERSVADLGFSRCFCSHVVEMLPA